MALGNLALYTTIYPGLEPYLPAWHESVLAQTDRDFDLWIGCQGVEPAALERILGPELIPHWVPCPEGDSPAQVRERAFHQIAAEYDALVLVDSDDVLHPTRVAAARQQLESCDVYACALRLMDQGGADLGAVLGLGEDEDLESVLPRWNLFGLSNSAYRAQTLCGCLPIPPDCVLLDWYLAMKAWGRGARLQFDRTCRMRYRQYQGNTARLLPPFSPGYILQATSWVCGHYRLILAEAPDMAPQVKAALVEAAGRAEKFREAVLKSSIILDEYVTALNKKPPASKWWTVVAHPELEHIWAKNST